MRVLLFIVLCLFVSITSIAQEKVLDKLEETNNKEEILEDGVLEEEEEEPIKLTAIEKAFIKLDLNSDDSIEFKEYQRGNMNIKSKSSNYSVRAMELSKKFSAIDVNSNNKIDIVEFESGMTPKKERAYILKKLQIFAKIDSNADDKIDLREFSRVKAIGRTKYYKKGKPQFREEKFAEIDTNDDGYINITEFEIDKKLVSNKKG